jgi:hypothetical protein
MGLFKDMKKLSDQGKQAAAAQGKPTTMTGMIKDLPNQVNQATQMMDQALGMQADMQRQQELLTTGTPARATIKSFADTGMLVNHNPQVILDLEVAVEGTDPYPAQLSTAVPQVYLSKLQPGGSIAVRVDPADPSAMVIDWAQP